MTTIKRKIITKQQFEPFRAEVLSFLESNERLPTDRAALDAALAKGSALVNQYVGLHIDGVGIPDPPLSQSLFETQAKLTLLKKSADEIKKKEETQLSKLAQSGAFEFDSLALAVAGYRIELGQRIAPTRRAILQAQLKAAESRMRVILLSRMAERKPLERDYQKVIADSIAFRKAHGIGFEKPTKIVAQEAKQTTPQPPAQPTLTSTKERKPKMTTQEKYTPTATEKLELADLEQAATRYRSLLQARGSAKRCFELNQRLAAVEQRIAAIQKGPNASINNANTDRPVILSRQAQDELAGLNRAATNCRSQLTASNLTARRKGELEQKLAATERAIARIESGESDSDRATRAANARQKERQSVPGTSKVDWYRARTKGKE